MTLTVVAFLSLFFFYRFSLPTPTFANFVLIQGGSLTVRVWVLAIGGAALAVVVDRFIDITSIKFTEFSFLSLPTRLHPSSQMEIKMFATVFWYGLTLILDSFYFPPFC